jgi:hypothetical protein
MRSIAAGVRNCLFAGTRVGIERATAIATLIENCKPSCVNPQTWVTQARNELADGHPADSFGEIASLATVACVHS